MTGRVEVGVARPGLAQGAGFSGALCVVRLTMLACWPDLGEPVC